ncbi:hypothetical protein RB653_008839 [Dictyostelium firmibasis]|uniref:EGF-like domain-containing protein n=1 Tax=Dictyostelium firmibasis TaxID=79012 RepID=A0AAN7U0Z7_9MYCE
MNNAKIFFYFFLIILILNFCSGQMYKFFDYTDPSNLNTYPINSQMEICNVYINLVAYTDLNPVGPPDAISMMSQGPSPSVSQNVISRNKTSVLYSILLTFEIGILEAKFFIDNSSNYISYNCTCKKINVTELSIEYQTPMFYSEYTSYATVFKIGGLIYPLSLQYNGLCTITPMDNNYFLLVISSYYYTSQSNDFLVSILFPNNESLDFNIIFNKSTPTLYSDIIGDTKLHPNVLNFTEMGYKHDPLFTFRSIFSKPIPQVFLLSQSGYFLLAKPIYGTPGNITYIVSTLQNFSPTNLSLYYQTIQNNFDSFKINEININIDYGSKINTSNQIIYLYNRYIYTFKATNLLNYDSKYFFYTTNYVVNDNSYGFTNGFTFPFGFVGGNNLAYTLNITTLSPENWSGNLTQSIDEPICGTVINFPIVSLNDVNTSLVGELISFETINLNEFKILIRFHIVSEYGVAFISIPTIRETLIGNQNLVSGTIYDGVWEYVYFGEEISFNERIRIITQRGSINEILTGQSFSVSNPSQILSISQNKLKGFSYSNDLSDVSFLYNNVNVTNQMVSNIMYFNFTNVDIYRNQTFGLYLLDSKSLRDENYDSLLFENLGSKYYFAEFDPIQNRFQVKFHISANILPGKLDYTIAFSQSSRIYSASLPESFQLNITSSLIDIQGPIFTNIVKYPNGNFGWVVTIEDSINGLDYGTISLFGLVDSSTYNFTINPSMAIRGNKYKGDYQIVIPFASQSKCITQDYIIKFVELFDTQGNCATFIKYFRVKDGSTMVKTMTNPFINFMNDTLINKITFNCQNQATLSTSPILHSFSSSKSSIDVGSINTVEFYFQVNDSMGIKDSQYPIVYLTTSTIDVIQCVSNLTLKTTNQFNYKCSIEIPIGFGYPNGILLSVYGFINNGGYYSGYCSQQLLEMNYTNFITTNQTYTLNQPYIKSSNKFSNQGGSLWIYGRGFGNDSIVEIKFSDSGFTSFTQYPTDLIYSSVISIQGVRSTNQPFVVIVKSSSKVSNEYIINPIIFNFNYTEPTTISPMPTNPPKKCLGNPECGGIDHGYCNNGVGCVCYSPWVGEDCTSKVIVIPQPSANTTDPTTDIPINGGSNETTQNNLYRSLISLVSLRELDFDGKQVKSFKFDKWIYTEINNSTNKYLSTISNKNNNGVIVETNVTVVLQWFEKNDTVLFAGQTLRMNPSSIKYTINITSYSFAKNLNSLQLVMSASLQSSTIDDICSSNSFGNTSDGDNSNYMKLNVNDHSVYGRFIKRAIVDNKIISVNNNFLNDSSSNSYTSEALIGISIPYYNYYALVDPDFSILVDSNPTSSNDENSICKSTSSKLSTAQLVGIIVGSVAFAAISVFIVSYAIIKGKQERKMLSDMNNKLSSMNKN